MTNENTIEFLIPRSRLKEAGKKLSSLTLKAQKLGLKVGVDYNYELGEDITKTLSDELGFTKEIVLVPLRVTTPLLRIAGWELLAALDHVEGEVIVRPAPCAKDIPEDLYRRTDTHCDHCNTNRRRNTIYVLRGEEGLKQVGSTCVDDFLGVSAVDVLHRLDWYYEVQRSISNFEDLESFLERGGNPGGEDLLRVLSVSAAIIAKHGFISKGRAWDEHLPYSTSDLVSENLNARWEDRRKDDFIVPNDSDTTLAEKVLSWLESLSERGNLNDYLHNLSVLGRLGYVPSKNLGLAVSAITAYEREKEKEARDRLNAELANSEYFGEVKRREVFELTYLDNRAWDSDYGLTVLHRFIDADGNLAIWKTKDFFIAPDHEGGFHKPKPGVAYLVRGTVKAHREFRGVKQTALSRCKVEGEITNGKAA